MKKILMMAAMAIMAVTVNAQVWVGGSLGLGFTKPDEGDGITTLNIAPMIGYDFNENIGAGIMLNEAYQSSGDLGVNQFEIVPFVRFYTNPLSNGLKFTFDAMVGFGWNKVKDADDSTNVLEIGVRPGVMYPLNDKVSLTASLAAIGWMRQSYDGEKIASAFNINVLNGASIGIVYKF